MKMSAMSRFKACHLLHACDLSARKLSKFRVLSIVLGSCIVSFSPAIMASVTDSVSLVLLPKESLTDTGLRQPRAVQKNKLSCSECGPNPFVGSWQLISGRYLDEKGLWVQYEHLHLNAIKVISNTYFSFTTVKENVELDPKKHDFWAAGTGRYEYTETQYTEYPTFNSFGADISSAFTFDYEFKGDELHTKRVEEGLLKEAEVWQKLD
jgi:hypothetical protein